MLGYNLGSAQKDPVLNLMLCCHPSEILDCVLDPVNYVAGPAEGFVLAPVPMDLGLPAEPGSLRKFNAGGLSRCSHHTISMTLH